MFSFLIFKSSRVFGKSLLFSEAPKQRNRWWLTDKENHKNRFLIIAPKPICGGLVGAYSPSLRTTQAGGGPLASLSRAGVPSRYWVCSPPLAPTLFPEALSRSGIPPLCLLLAWQTHLASGFSLLLFPLVFVFFHKEMFIFIPLFCFLYAL